MKKEGNMMTRTLYEYAQLNRFWLLPVMVVLTVWGLDLAWTPPKAQWGIVLLTLIYLVWFCLPRPDWWKLAVYYGHDRLFRSTVLTGLIAALGALIMGHVWFLWVCWTDAGLAFFSCLNRWRFTYKKA